jgi:hypothetical protein
VTPPPDRARERAREVVAELYPWTRVDLIPMAEPRLVSLIADGMRTFADERVREVIRMLREMEWHESDGQTYCVICKRFKRYGHMDDCRLMILLRGSEPDVQSLRGGTEPVEP